MKKIKSVAIDAKDKTIKYLKKVKREHLIKKYFKHNVLFLTFVGTCVLNSTMLRFLTMHTLENYLAFKPIMADLAFAVLLGSFGYLFKPKNRFTYFFIMSLVLTFICTVNSIYYTFYTSFASVSMLSLTQYIGEVGDAVTENVFQVKDVMYIIGPIILILVHRYLKKKDYYKVEIKKVRKNKFVKTIIAGGIITAIFCLTLSPLEIGRFTKQWNREYIVMRFGIYVYQVNDLIASVQPKINSMFGYDKAKVEFNEYFKDKKKSPENEYTDIFKDKNIIVIHGESMQTNTIGLKFNDKELTPTLNKLSQEGMYFSNFYSQVSVGTSSDTELTYNTSLMPTQSGTAFVSYFDREYISTPKFLKKQGYYVYSMHANNADFWNRRTMHKSLGYDKFYSKETYDVKKEDLVGLGLSDKSFFAQSVQKMVKINEKHPKWYGLSIMLSNHTPFSAVDKYGDFPVDIKEEKTNEDGTVETISHPYMEGTKLGNYFKSVHYADEALGQFINDLDKAGLLENTILILYGDHDGRLPKKDYSRLYNYDTNTDKVKEKDDPTYVDFDYYKYELGRKVPFIIWSKDMAGTDLNMEVTDVMGMYDVMPTLGNMLGFYNKYALGHDIFDIGKNNIVVFPNGNFVTNKIYYNSQKQEYLSLDNSAVSEEYIKEKSDYTEKLLNVSNNIIVFDLLKDVEK
ncbi:MAG: LTA synthase family protein [Bacilli bacterium]|nr:LTA synthase family protein [Bacilli bacterium]